MRLKIRVSIVDKKTQEGWLVIASNNEAYFELKDVEGFLWSLLKTPKTLDDLVNQVVERYQVDKAEAKTDIEAFIKLAIKEKLLEMTDD